MLVGGQLLDKLGFVREPAAAPRETHEIVCESFDVSTHRQPPRDESVREAGAGVGGGECRVVLVGGGKGRDSYPVLTPSSCHDQITPEGRRSFSVPSTTHDSLSTVVFGDSGNLSVTADDSAGVRATGMAAIKDLVDVRP